MNTYRITLTTTRPDEEQGEVTHRIDLGCLEATGETKALELAHQQIAGTDKDFLPFRRATSHWTDYLAGGELSAAPADPSEIETVRFMCHAIQSWLAERHGPAHTAIVAITWDHRFALVDDFDSDYGVAVLDLESREVLDLRHTNTERVAVRATAAFSQLEIREFYALDTLDLALKDETTREVDGFGGVRSKLTDLEKRCIRSAEATIVALTRPLHKQLIRKNDLEQLDDKETRLRESGDTEKLEAFLAGKNDLVRDTLLRTL